MSPKLIGVCAKCNAVCDKCPFGIVGGPVTRRVNEQPSLQKAPKTPGGGKPYSCENGISAKMVAEEQTSYEPMVTVTCERCGAKWGVPEPLYLAVSEMRGHWICSECGLKLLNQVFDL